MIKKTTKMTLEQRIAKLESLLKVKKMEAYKSFSRFANDLVKGRISSPLTWNIAKQNQGVVWRNDLYTEFRSNGSSFTLVLSESPSGEIGISLFKYDDKSDRNEDILQEVVPMSELANTFSNASSVLNPREFNGIMKVLNQI